ncbi:MAG: hypothetical protein FD121_1644, partial [Gallionellaceae bacterium]
MMENTKLQSDDKQTNSGAGEMISDITGYNRIDGSQLIVQAMQTGFMAFALFLSLVSSAMAVPVNVALSSAGSVATASSTLNSNVNHPASSLINDERTGLVYGHG